MNKAITTGVLGVVFGLGTILSQDTIIKDLSDHYSVIQLLFLRSLFALILLFCLIPFLSPGSIFQSNRLGLQILRGTLQFLSFFCYYIALKRMPIIDLVTLFFCAPLIAVALSVPVLKERVTVKHWSAIAIGFAGAILMIGTTGIESDQSSALIALGAAVLYAGSIVATRVLGKSDPSTTTTLYTLIMYTSLACIAIPAMEYVLPVFQPNAAEILSYWITPTIQDLGLLAIAASAVTIAFLMLAYAYQQAPVSILAPWEYSALIWGGLFGYLFWEETPSVVTVLGAVLIVSTGIYISRLESADFRKNTA